MVIRILDGYIPYYAYNKRIGESGITLWSWQEYRMGVEWRVRQGIDTRKNVKRFTEIESKKEFEFI
jgi:hypothetical protein